MLHRVGAQASLGAGLREIIEAVWSPASTGVQVTLGSTRGVIGSLESYLVLPNRSRPRLLLPADDIASARRALGAYRGLRTARAEAWSRVIGGSVLSSASAARLLHRLSVSASPDAERLLPRLAELLGRDDLRAMLAVRRPGPFSKPTLGLVDRAGNPVAYAKLGRSDLTDTMVANEAATLQTLRGRLSTIVVPSLRTTTTWQGHPVTVVDPLPLTARRLAVEPLQMPDTMWEVASSGPLVDDELRESSYARRLRQRLEACRLSHPEVGGHLTAWFERLCAADLRLRFGRSHGDWVSWNLGMHAGRVVVWDWESSVPDAPVGFDACHWYFQRARARAGVAAAAAAVDAIAPGLSNVGVAEPDVRRVADLYVLDACVESVEAAAASDGAGREAGVFAELARRRDER